METLATEWDRAAALLGCAWQSYRGYNCMAKVLPSDTPARGLVLSNSTRDQVENIQGSTFFYDIEPYVPRLDHNVRRVFDITDIGAVVYKLHIFYVN